MAENDFAQQVVAQSIDAHDPLDGQRSHDVALGLGHLAALEDEPAVGPHLLGQGQAGRHQERGPVDGVKADDLLADQVDVNRPQALVVRPRPVVLSIADRAHVGRERVEPDVEHVLGIVGQGDSPAQRGTANRQVVQARPHESHDLVAPGIGLDELRLGFVQLQQFLLEGGEAEEVVLLGDRRDHLRISGRGFLIGDKGFVAEVILAGVAALVDRTVGQAALEDLAHSQGVARVAGAPEEVAFQAEFVPFRAKCLRDAIGELLRLQARRRSGTLDLLPVLVAARSQVGIVAQHAPDPLDRIGHDRRVGMADVGRGVDVVDGRRDVEIRHSGTLVLVLHGGRPRDRAARRPGSAGKLGAPVPRPA